MKTSSPVPPPPPPASSPFCPLCQMAARRADPFTAVNRLQVNFAVGHEPLEGDRGSRRGRGAACGVPLPEYAEGPAGCHDSSQIYLKSPRGSSASGAGRRRAVFTLSDAELSRAAFQNLIQCRVRTRGRPCGWPTQSSSWQGLILEG